MNQTVDITPLCEDPVDWPILKDVLVKILEWVAHVNINSGSPRKVYYKSYVHEFEKARDLTPFSSLGVLAINETEAQLIMAIGSSMFEQRMDNIGCIFSSFQLQKPHKTIYSMAELYHAIAKEWAGDMVFTSEPYKTILLTLYDVKSPCIHKLLHEFRTYEV